MTNIIEKENREIESLVDGIQYALEGSSSTEAIEKMISYVGAVTGCDRIYIYVLGEKGDYENAFEWCNAGVASEKDLLAHIPFEVVHRYLMEMEDLPVLMIDNVEELKDTDKYVYDILKQRNTRTFVADEIQYRGTNLGFIGIDNLDPALFHPYEKSIIAITYLIGEIMHNDIMEKRLDRMGLIDKLTGVGNRHSLYESFETTRRDSAVGLVYLDILGLKRINDEQGVTYGDKVIIDTANILTKYFGDSNVFRIEGDEFVVLSYGLKESLFEHILSEARLELDEKKIPISIGSVYEEKLNGNLDSLLKMADLRLYNEKRTYYRKVNLEEVEKEEKQDDVSAQAIDLICDVNYTADTYRVLYRYKDLYETMQDEGVFSECIKSFENCINVEDTESFRQFWSDGFEERIRSKKTGELSIEYRLMDRNGDWYWVRETVSLVDSDDDILHLICTVKNISSIHKSISLLDLDGKLEIARERAQIDLYSQDEAFSRADNWIEKTNVTEVAMIAIDLNNFKLYNSIFGRKSGDRLLEMVGEVVKDTVQKYGGVGGYMGGDNFLLIIPSDKLKRSVMKEQIENQIERLSLPNGFSPSFGVCITKDKTLSARVLYERALLMIGTIRSSYTDHVAFFDERVYLQSQQNQLLLMDIEKALKNDEFTFFLQPKVNMRTRKIVSFEALVRWVRNGEVISPTGFVDLMEDTGYIHELDLYIWESVCKYQRELLDQGRMPVPISVNVSRADFHFGDVAKNIIDLTNKYDLNHSLFQLEITESAFARDPEIINKATSKLHDNNFTILMDDFGKGYSSLNSLREMHVDVLKLDKKFIEGMDEDAANKNIIDSIIRMAHLMKIHVVAEGVESQQQVENLLELHCRYAQGYYFFGALTKEEAMNLIYEENIERGQVQLELQRIEDVHFDELVDNKLITANQLNKMIGALSVVRLEKNKVEIVQMNSECAKLFDIPEEDDKERERKARSAVLEKIMSLRTDVFQEADRHPKDGFTHIGKYPLANGEESEMMGTIFPLESDEDSNLYLLWLRRP